MDEIDGMSAGDRGGVGALKKIITTTKVYHLTMQSNLDSHHLHLQRPTASKTQTSGQNRL